jgi:beta-galactosidase
MQKIKFNEGWKFWEEANAFALTWSLPENAKDVTIPHDAMIERTPYAESPNGGKTGFRDGGNYNYVNYLRLQEGEEGMCYFINFEGVYSHALVYVNGQKAGGCANGYTSFYVDITEFLEKGRDNEIRVLVKNGGAPNSRWYSGSGIYRDVYLLKSEPVHIAPAGVRVRTVEADPDGAVLLVETEVANESSRGKDIVLTTFIGKTGSDGGFMETAKEKTPLHLTAGERVIAQQRIFIASPDLWSEETPTLYQVDSVLSENGKPIDENHTRTGIRTLSLSSARGLRVNGKEVKLRGACIHHDCGILGAAEYQDAKYRQIRGLKQAGFNAVRISHHPASPALLDACDALGVYVMDEFSDMWTRPKNDHDYALDFDENWAKDVAYMVKKDYNHPSVILYSVGNEIPEIGTKAGTRVCRNIADTFRKLDPSRYTTAGINGVYAAGDQVGQIMVDIASEMQEQGEAQGDVNDFMTLMDTKMDEIVAHDIISERLEVACAPLDVAGYNYMAARYESDRERYPNRVIVGTETYPPEIPRNWELVKRLPNVLGDFTWTGWDYIGEAGVGVPAYTFGEGGFTAMFPCQLAYCGDMDLIGTRRPLSYFREIVFGLRKEPYITVQNPYRYGQKLIKTPWVLSDAISSWTYPEMEGKPVIVEVYAPGTKVELYLNGRRIGEQPSGQKAGFISRFEMVYEPGELEAVCFDGEKELGRCHLATTGSAASISFRPETGRAEGLVYIDLELRDGQGNLVQNEDRELTVSVEGAELLGLGSGNPKPKFTYTGSVTETYLGRAQMVLRKQDAQVNVTVKTADGLNEELSF